MRQLRARPALALGLTLSPVQARLARQRAARLGLLDRVHFIEADFQALPLPTGFDLAWSVEAFLHAEDPACYFRQAARLLRTGGRLILCDDFLAEGLSEGAAPRAFQPRAASWLGAFHQGWHAPGLRSAAQVERLAGESGLRLVRNTDLTPHLRLRVLPDRLARAILAFGRRLPLKHAILPSMLGSLALQQCLRYGWIEYRFLVFEK
jgi:SAM-dependent methyltransferase